MMILEEYLRHREEVRKALRQVHAWLVLGTARGPV